MIGRAKPAHVPYWRVSNPTLWHVCISMIGRADIEGSNSNVAWTLHCHMPGIPVVFFLTPLNEHSSDLKDWYVMSSQFLFVLKIKIKQAFPLSIHRCAAPATCPTSQRLLHGSVNKRINIESEYRCAASLNLMEGVFNLFPCWANVPKSKIEKKMRVKNVILQNVQNKTEWQFSSP